MRSALMPLLKIKSVLLFFLGILIFQLKLNAEDFIEVNCHIYDFKANLVKALPYQGSCAYMPDGKVIMFNEGSLQMYDRSNKLLWKVKGPYHHQMKINFNQDRIYILSSVRHYFHSKTVRLDSIEAIDLKNGKTIAVFDIFKNLFDFATDENFHLQRSLFQSAIFPADFDISHANSVFEIPDNQLSTKHQAFKKGNWLINFGLLRYLIIVDKDLKKILWKKSYSNYAQSIHDAQVNSKGEVVSYSNAKNSRRKNYTSILFLDPLKDAPDDFIREVTPTLGGATFFQDYVGGFQYQNNGDLLVSVFTHEYGFQLALFDPTLKLKLIFTPNPQKGLNRGEAFQDAKVFNLSKFLKNRDD